MKLIFLNRFFYPDHSATSQVLSDLAFALAERGRGVHVITGRQRYDSPAEPLPAHEIVGGVTVHRVWTSRFGRTNLGGRAVDYATFYVSAGWRLLRLMQRCDVVVAKTDPPMLSVMAALLCRVRGGRLINWLQDIFPEVAQNLGLGARGAALAYRPLRYLRNRSLKAARKNVVLGTRMGAHLIELGIPREQVAIIHNWADGRQIAPVAHADNALRSRWDLNGAFVVGYSGNLGRAHEIETIMGAMQTVAMREATPLQAPRSPPIVWLFIGSGSLFKELQRKVEKRQLTSVLFKPYQPRSALSSSLGAADVHLVSLRPELEGLIVPSKFYGVAAAGRPAIFIGEENGEIAQLLARHRCGLTVPVGDAARLAQTVVELASNPDHCRQLGINARQAFASEYDKPIALARWEQVLSDVCEDPR